MNKLVWTGTLMLAMFAGVNAAQTQSEPPRDMSQMLQMGQMMDKCLMNTKDVQISVSDTEGGIALTFKPSDPSQLEALRKSVRAHVEMMQKGECGMMQRMMGPSHNH
jgi:hypothetical protein